MPLINSLIFDHVQLITELQSILTPKTLLTSCVLLTITKMIKSKNNGIIRISICW